jgi:hypothetical protein
VRSPQPDSRAPELLGAGVGAAVMLLGAALAILCVPEDVTPVGAITFSSWVLAIALVAPMVPGWRNDVRTLLRGENMLVLALAYWTLSEALQGRYSVLVSRDTVEREYLVIGLAAAGFWIGAKAGGPIMPGFIYREALRPWSTRAAFAALVIAFALGTWDFLYRSDFDTDLIVSSLLSSRWDTPWQRESLGDWSAFSYHLQYFGYLVPPMAILVALKSGWRSPRTWIGFAMSFTVLAFQAQGGGRRIVGAMILAGLFCWLIHVRQLNLRRILAALGVVAGLVALLQLMLIYRNVGFGDTADALPHFDYVFVDDNFLRMGQMMEYVPDLQPFVGLRYLVYVIVRPVPRVFWPGKPVDGGFDLAELLGIPDTTFMLTAPGEMYVSYGYLAVIAGALLYGRLATIVNGLYRYPHSRLNPVFPSLMLVWLFVGVRTMVELVLMGYVLLAATAIGMALNFVKSLKPGTARSGETAPGR